MDTLEKKTKVKELWQLCFHDDERFVNLLSSIIPGREYRLF